MVAGWPAPRRGFPDEDSVPASLYDVAEWMAEAAREAREAGLGAEDEEWDAVLAAGLWLAAAASDAAWRRPLQYLGIPPTAVTVLRTASGTQANA
eukprot:4035405-Alexandrium_andersonii.AAC.1